MRSVGPLLTCALIAIAVALVTPTDWQDWAADRLTPQADRVDDRVLVVAFSDAAAESTFLRSIPHRDAQVLTTITERAAQGGATAVVLVGFDGFALTGGPSDRALIRDTAGLQRIGIDPLLDVTLDPGQDGIPDAVAYRVDDLAGEFAGLGMPDVQNTSGVVHTVPSVVRVPRLEPGLVVRSADRQARGTLVLGVAARAAATADPQPVDATADYLDVAGTQVPLESGSLRIRWSRALNDTGDAAVLPAGRVLGDAGKADVAVPPSTWAGRIVLVGTTNPMQTPYLDTPIGPMPELLVQANALNTLLTGEYLRPGPPAAPLAATGAAVAALAALWWRRRRWATAVGLIIVSGWVAVSAVSAAQGLLLDPLRPVVGVTAMLVGLGTMTLARRLAERRRLSRLFSEYVPRDVARDLIESGRAQVAQAGERLTVTVLFCDLRGFTPIAARLTPADVRSLLDRYYETFSRIVFDHGGTVLQYTGDEIFAVFGAPLPRSDHADAGLACARAMQEALPAHNATAAIEHLPEIEFGIGLHSGLVVAAHVGSSIRRQYSIIGDTVNIGSRLCAQARIDDIVWSSATQDRLTSPGTAHHDGEVTLKGIEAPVTIYRYRRLPTS